MKNIGFVANLDRDINGEYLQKVTDWLLSKGLSPIIRDSEAAFINNHSKVTSGDELYRLSDLVVGLGGDGTMIGASKKAAMYGVPVMGINLGTLGYLTDAGGGEAGIESLRKAIFGDYKTEKRMMLEASILDENRKVVMDKLYALNDVCVLRGTSPKAKSYSLKINGDYLDKYKADGIIIATPTGSTAYNLSAGGPILRPDMECIAITPICPHKMNSRPLVVSAHDVMNVEVFGDYEGEDINEVMLSLDCQHNIGVKEGYSVEIRRSEKYVTLIKTNDLGFYDILRKKMH